VHHEYNCRPVDTSLTGKGRMHTRAYMAIALASCRRALGEYHSSLVPWRLVIEAADRRKATMTRYEMRIAEQLGLQHWTRLESLVGQCMYYLDLFPRLAGCIPADIDAMRVVRHVYTARQQQQQKQQQMDEKKKKSDHPKVQDEQEYKQCLARIACHFDELVVRLRIEYEDGNDDATVRRERFGKRAALSEMKSPYPLDRKIRHQDRIVTAVIAYLTLHYRLKNYKFRHADDTSTHGVSLAKDLQVRHENFCARVKMELSTFRACLQNLDAYFQLPVVRKPPSSSSSPMAWVEGTSVNDFGD
jgi:hypothetical protein